MNVTRDDIVQGLRAFWVGAWSDILVHSSLKSFGFVEGGAEAVVDALLESVAPTGTIMVPTLTGSSGLSPSNPPEFDVDDSPCWTGAIPEAFRKRPDAIRSLHATHSIAAIGVDSIEYTKDHLDSVTPCDENSPYGKLARNPNGYVLLLGVGHERNTLFHHVEEAAGVDYHIQKGFARSKIIAGSEIYYRHILLHQYGTRRDFGIMEPLFIERGIQQITRIGDAEIRLIHAPGMVDVTLKALRANQRILCGA